MKSASISSPKWAERAAAAAQDYVTGAQQTTKDQAARAIAAIAIMKQALIEAIDQGRVAKGLQASGKAGWLAGIVEKGSANFSTGVTSPRALSKYTQNSAKFDSARASSEGMPRGVKGSAQNLAKVSKVVSAMIAAKKA